MNTCTGLVVLTSVLLSIVYAAPTLKSTRIWDCGPDDKVVLFRQTSLSPSPVVYPGNVTIATHMQLLEDLPSHSLKVRIQLEKLEPERMAVPCMNGIGSCVYDVCSSIITKQKDIFCALGACECPLQKKVYLSRNLPVQLPRIGGPVFAQILEGNFEGSITFYNNETERVYGCLGMELAIRASTEQN